MTCPLCGRTMTVYNVGDEEWCECMPQFGDGKPYCSLCLPKRYIELFGAAFGLAVALDERLEAVR